MQKIHSITNLEVSLLKSNPPRLYIKARGLTSSSAWTNIELVPHIYVTPPADGIVEIDFMGLPPKGVRNPYLEKVIAPPLVSEIPEWLKGIRVITETNSMEYLYTGPAMLDAAEDKDGDIDIEFMFDENKELEIDEISPEDVENEFFNIIEDDLDSGTERDLIIQHDLSNTLAKTWEIRVVKISSWPEVRTRTCYRWVRIPFNGRTRVPYPCIWTRSCKKSWFLRITYGGSTSLPNNIEKILKECAKIALVPALPILLVGNVAGAVAAFLGAFKPCLVAKGIQQASSFSVGFIRRKECGKWHRV